VPRRNSVEGDAAVRQGSDGTMVVSRSTPCALFVYYREWFDEVRVEWEPMARAAAMAGTTAVVACWEDLEAEAGVARVRDAFLCPAGADGCTRVPAVECAPTIVFTTWGSAGYRGVLAELLAAGALSSEGEVVAHMDGKIELERCLRRYEQASGRSVDRPTTYLPDEPLPSTADPSRLVVLKPSGGGQGKGIQIVEAGEVAAYQQRVTDGDFDPFVVQELIGDAFLYDGHRWGMRLNVLITSLTPVRYVLYPEGVAKVSVRAASPGGRSLDEWIDNDAPSRPARLPVTSMLQHLEREHGVSFDKFWPQARELVEDVVGAIALEAQRLSLPLGRTFLYPGLDLLLERRGEREHRVCLIELNSHPGQDWRDEPVQAGLTPVWMAWFEELEQRVLSAASPDGD